MQVQVGALAAIPQLESRTDEQLQGESRHRVAAKAILGARAAERYDAKTARAYFNEALAGCASAGAPALRQMMKASLALAERRPDELRDAMEKLGQEAPSGRQMFMLRMMGLLIPPASAGMVARDPRHPPDRRARDRAARDRHRDRPGDRPRSSAASASGSSIFFGFLLVVVAHRRPGLLGQTQAGESPGRARGAAAALAQFSAADSRRRCSRASGSSGPSSVKMRDHHPPDQVAALRVALALRRRS